MKKVVIIVFVILILSSFLGLIIVINSRSEESKSEKINLNPNSKISPKAATTIVLTATGFQPKEITITPNTKVIWINQSNQLATVDSNPHPIHTEHSELNLGEFGNGEKIGLIFPQTGVFKFHNHYNPDQGGTIIVQ